MELVLLFLYTGVILRVSVRYCMKFVLQFVKFVRKNRTTYSLKIIIIHNFFFQLNFERFFIEFGVLWFTWNHLWHFRWSWGIFFCKSDPDITHIHYNNVTWVYMASEITDHSSVCSTVCSSWHQRNTKDLHYWPFVKGSHRSPWGTYFNEICMGIQQLSFIAQNDVNTW